jgi:RNA polymerase sigma-70 factor (ECF subfamily)
MFGFGKRINTEDAWSRFEEEAMPYRQDLFRTAVWLTRDHHQAEELVQEVMFQALRSFHNYEKETNCKAWLMRILYNHNARRLAKDNRMRMVDDPDEVVLGSVPFETPILESLTDEQVIQALWRLPEKFREVVVLSDVEDLKYREISSVLELPIGTVMSRLSRGRKMLRIELSEYAREMGFGLTQTAAKG